MHHSRRSSDHTARPTLTTTPPRGRGGRVHELASQVAQAAAERDWRAWGARTPSEAHGLAVGQARRSWGLTATFAFARHRLARVH